MYNKLEITSDEELRALQKKHESTPLGIESHAILYACRRELDKRSGKFDADSLREDLEETRARAARFAAELDSARKQRDELKKRVKELEDAINSKAEIQTELTPSA